jgi:ABC-type multidrug transport system ATPase subunit
MENILELQQVSKTFSKSNFALENVTFSLPYGSIMGFVGENGAGKTTTIGCILNTIAKDSGMVKLFGKEMTDADTDMRERPVLFPLALGAGCLATLSFPVGNLYQDASARLSEG